MFRRLREFYRHHIAADVPIEMDLCLDCGELECSETRFAECPRRKARAAELAASGTASPEGSRPAKANASGGLDDLQRGGDTRNCGWRLRAVKRTPRSQWNDALSAGSGPSRGGRGRRASRPRTKPLAR